RTPGAASSKSGSNGASSNPVRRSCRAIRSSRVSSRRRPDALARSTLDLGLPEMIELGVNIDHVATVRQARRTYEPDPVAAAVEAELGGADGITVHLREDRRHINDRDVQALRETVQCKLNLEMSIAPEIVEIAAKATPDQATIVPERRQEITTEGGIDLSQQSDRITSVVGRLRGMGVFVSAFIEPDE